MVFPSFKTAQPPPFDIYTAAKITADQFASFNPGLDCSLIQIGQQVCISAGTLPSSAPSTSANGTCYEYVVVPNDSCSAIATKFTITVEQIQTWNVNTYKWTGCANIQIGLVMCVSPGTPPPIPVNPLLECGPESKGNATCALKACCSAFGFCGLTDEFCHTSVHPQPLHIKLLHATLPSCGTGRTMRNIGYYAGWADRRPCGVIAPNQIDWSGYTHAHFAFAVISQASEIALASADAGLLQQLVAQKSANPALKVLIAVGGWDFSEGDPTRNVFSVMIGSAATRAAFIASAKTFLTTYELDGIDIDFEYPGAIERDAPATDTPNLTQFFTELRAALPSAIISCATPAGYWFLKGFEIDLIVKSVDYLNMMSYDYHGPWDTNVRDQASVASPHTSLADMKVSALLYTRAGIDLSKVNLGLAWYGRTYHLADAACKGYNCTVYDRGGAPGKCSGASGYLTQFEITDLLSGGGQPTLDAASETYWFETGGDLITFDQADTWAIKQNFAGTTCFGGTFVWSMDEVLGPGGISGSDPSGGVQSFTVIPWNPNPGPSAAAPSETFIGAGTTVAIPIPQATTFITVGGAIITLNAGGTPVNALLPATVTEPAAVTPTWTYNIVPPFAPSITFTAPISGAATFTTVIPSPTSGAVVTVGGPGGESWTLTGGAAGPSVVGTLPTSVGIVGGTTPTATPPVGWLGPWTDPVPPHSVTTMQPVQSNTQFTWNPNPHPNPTAPSETFACSGTTTSLAIPVATTTISVGGATIVLNSGGTPVNEPLSSQCTEIGGIFPTWSLDILPPPGAATITFTGPLTGTPTWLSTVPVPPKTDSPVVTVIGPPGDKNRCNPLDFWSLLFGGIIRDCLPLDVGIIGGITPVPVPPPGWTGPWTNPIPRPTPAPDDTKSDSTSQSSSSTSTACPAKPTSLSLPDDADNSDWDGQGTDPDRRRRLGSDAYDVAARRNVTLDTRSSDALAANATYHSLSRRANRRIAVNRCPGVQAISPTAVLLGSGTYVTLDPNLPNWATTLVAQNVGGKPTVAGETNQEHVFELGYISQFVGAAPMTNGDCNWVQANLFDYVRTDGTTMGNALVTAIDTVNNMVWVDKPLNQAKSNVVNQNSDTAANPPQLATMQFLSQVGEFDSDAPQIYAVEDFLRHLAALGSYFGATAPIFRATAVRVQNLLAEITPSSVIVSDASLPLLFYAWLGNLLGGYSNGCTSRGTNAWNYYNGAMRNIAIREGQAVPACFELYNHGVFTPSTFNFQTLMPPAPQAPHCNVPGTTGVVYYVQTVPVGVLAPVGTMPYGNDYYAVGSGPSLSGSHVQGRALDGNQYSGCGGSFLFNDVPRGTAGYATAQIDEWSGHTLLWLDPERWELTLDGTLFAIECWADPMHDFVFASRGFGTACTTVGSAVVVYQ
ncbi:hypothetical protein B0H10DRAFT_2230831 [Mycena sp. CBHHK59/15]|nr:hypothetical protein B0H10DRAFT_2230831 [Mycena sp. CBHHK59/15]